MIRLLILFALGVAIGLFIVKLLSKQQDEKIIAGEVVDGEAKPRTPSLLTILLLGAVLAAIVLFILPRFGISVMGVLQKAITFLPMIRGLLPF